MEHVIEVQVTEGLSGPTISVSPDTCTITIDDVQSDTVRWQHADPNAVVRIKFEGHNPFDASGLDVRGGTNVNGQELELDNYEAVRLVMGPTHTLGDFSHRQFKYIVKVDGVGELDPVIVVVGPKTP